MLSSNALNYTFQHLLQVAFPAEETVQTRLEVAGGRASLSLGDSFVICMNLLSDEEIMQLRKGCLPARPFSVDSETEPLPMFIPYSSDRELPEFDAEHGVLHIPFDMLTLPFLLLSKLDECDDSPRDQHGRFQYVHSMAAKYGFVMRPVVDEYALLLRHWVIHYNIELNFSWRPRDYTIMATHDIDLLQRFHSPLQAYKSMFGRDLLLEHSCENFRISWGEYRKWRANRLHDPYLVAISDLAQQDKEHGVDAVFFFKAQLEGEYDATYNYCVPAVSRTIDTLQQLGFTVGLHGSYESLGDQKQLKNEKQRLDTLTLKPVTHSRQHYLRFTPDHSQTILSWLAAGIQHDYTLGYAEQPGFRCGTCHPYRLYDLEHDCSTNIMEHPLILMDGSLIDYLKLNIEDSIALIRLLKQRCQSVEGDFVYLWHNHTTRRGFRNHYVRCVNAIFQ